MDVLLVLGGYFLLINLIGFISMGMDKSRAVNKRWRIPEATLFILAIIGGSVGSIIGMKTFHHKTRHWYFVYGMPAILVLQIASIIGLIYSPLSFIIM